VVKSHSCSRTMIIWKAPIPETIVARCLRANWEILISRPPHSHSQTLCHRALPNRLLATGVVEDPPQVRRSECRTILHGRDSACAAGPAWAERGRKDECIFARRQRSLYQKVGRGCTGFPVSDNRRVLIAQRPVRSRNQFLSRAVFRRLSSSFGPEESRTG